THFQSWYLFEQKMSLFQKGYYSPPPFHYKFTSKQWVCSKERSLFTQGVYNATTTGNEEGPDHLVQTIGQCTCKQWVM
ncbi:hypothetical protein KSS87_000816, partial [Heliosperma pusillum]